ncbi:rho GTPase-activating protein 21-like isoform X11 [Daphnia pulex]|uniref:rho GTPase-activating protein 21-like isoform X11 n=1 Tax=Daphnia pulex TaxID=6669 RepID=UPI001EDDA713|nr:rho GTPase-activating protein 21-like isoform X11 [Daphnia pulex]
MMAEPSSSHSKPTVQQQQQVVANELSSSKTSTLPVRDRLNTPAPTQHPRTDAISNSGDGRNVRGPRCITIQRSSAGFGFTLRHFIVYPPDSVSDCPEEWQRGMSAGLLDPMIPMDTIFVKHVRENGPAVKAGLSTGDQVVSVNGESVMCKSYAQVVQMIQKSGPNLQLVVMPKEHDVLQQCFADTAHNPYTNARPVIPAAGSAEDQTGKMTMMMDPLKPNNIMSHLPRPKPYQPFQVETKKPVTPQQQAGAHVQKATQQQPLGRVLSPLVTAGTTTTTTTTTAAISRPTVAAASDDAAVAAQARLAAAAALVSKSVRKSADFNPNGGAAGSRGSLVGGGGGGDYYPGATTGFSSSSVSAVSAVHSKRSSYAGTPTCKTEFIHSINAPAAFTSPPAAAGSVGGHARYADPSSLPHQHHHHHQQQQPQQQHHQFHYPVHPMEMVAAIHGSVSSLQQQQQNLRDSPLNSSKGSLYSAASECNEQQSHQQAQVMTRIKKSFEQKEEFLKRPALPYWVNVQEAQQSPPVPKEFYAQPQKFARPVWPPISASLTASLDSLSSSDVTTTPTQQQPPQQLQQQQQHHKSTAVTKTEVIHTGITSMEPWSVSFTSKRATPPASPSQSPGAVGLGLVPNTVPKPFYGSTNTTTTTTTTTTVTASSNSTGSPSGNKQFVSTLSRIQENIAAEPPPEPKPSRQLTLMHAPLASPEEFFTPSPTKAGQHPLAASSVATANQSSSAAGASAAAAPVVVKRTKPFENGAEKGLLARIAQRGKQQQEAAAVAAAAVAAAAAASAAAAERYSKSTSEFQRVPAGGSGNRTVIIGSSNLHCQPPAMEMEFPPNTYDAQVTWNEEEERKSLVLRQHSYRSAVRDFGSSSLGSSGSITVHQQQESQQSLTKMTTTPAATASVNRRQKIYDDDSDRGMRRISYLKAQAGNPVDGPSLLGSATTTEAETVVTATTNTATTTTTPINNEHTAKGRSAHQPHSIQKLRSLFGDTKVSLTSKSQQQGGGGDSSGAHPPSPSEAEGREGWLYVKQTIIDCRRSTDRSWRQMWTRIRSGTVHFTRDRNTAMASNGNNSYSSYNSNSGSTPGAGADDMMIDLRGCTVEVAVYYTKRKNVLRLSTFNGLCEYLMQCEDSSDMVLWLDSFQQEQAAANSSDKEDGPGSSYSSSEMMLVRQAHEADNNSMAHGRRMGRFTLHRNRSPTGHSPVSKTRKPSLPGTIGGGGGGGGSNSTDGPNSTPANANKPTTWRRKVVQQFKKIQGNSPNSQANAMIPEGATIGVPLEFCPRSSLSESIPLIVELCVGIVEARGLESVGVYRVPGNSVAVNALSDSLNRGFDGLNQSDPRWNDVNVISSLMKSFFRKLPEPLVTSELYGALIEASKTEPEQVRFNSIKRLVDELPEPHYSTLRYLVGHLSRVAGKSHVNKMEARNLAIVFGPTLIRPGDDSTVTMVTDMSHQCRIVETLIDKVDFFFPPDQDQPVDPVQQQQQQQPNSPTTLASNSNLLSSADERKDSYAKEIVLSIITAARKKRQTSLDSPDLSERGDAAPAFPVVVTTTASATMTTATISTTLIMATQYSSSATVPTGSAHSLVELGSTGGQPALPVEASEFRLSTAEVPATPPTVERKRSASLGGETVMPPPSPILAMADLAGITEMGTDGLAQASGSSEPFRSRTSSGSFVVNKLHPIDAAGIRSYSGLSAVTQERIRLFEQETKAMLQRDLARQVRREGEPMPVASAGGIRRLDKTEVESAWHRAKLEMETDDFLDVLADNLSEVADSTADASHKDKDNQPEQQQQQQPQQQQAEQPKTRVDPLPVAVVMENGGADEKLLPRPINEKEPEAVQVLPAVQKEQDNVPVAEEKLDEKPAVELQVGNAVVVKSSAGRIVAANKTTATTTTTTVKQQTTIVAGVAGAVGRSQIPKPSATANKSANDPAPTKVAAVDSAKISPTKSTMSISSSSAVRSRSSMAVVGRAKTVELGKSAVPPAGKKMSVGELQAPKVIRQLSAGQMQPQSPSRILPVKGNARLKSAETSPTKKASIASLNKTEETKKAATTTDGEQSKRLLESNLDEAVNISDQPRGGLKETELADRANSKQPSVRRESKSAEVVGKGVKRSDSLTKNEKTESNTKAREREMRQTGGQKTAKKFVQRSGESGLKRRHTVGGTRDFDKVRIRWLADKSDERNVIPAPRWSAWDRLQPLISDEDLNVDRSLKTWMRSERIRTSSPELCRRSEMACATIINNSLSPPPLTDSQPLEAPSSAIRADGDVSSP